MIGFFDLLKLRVVEVNELAVDEFADIKNI